MRETTLKAELVVDSHAQGRRFGLRSTGAVERRLLFRAPGTHVELRIAPARSGAPSGWVHGMVVEPGRAAPAGERIRVRWSAVGQKTTEVEACETGEFALPCDPSGSFLLELFPPGRDPVAVHVDAQAT